MSTCFIGYTKVFDWIITNCGMLLEGNTGPSYLSPEVPICGQEATIRTMYGTTD